MAVYEYGPQDLFECPHCDYTVKTPTYPVYHRCSPMPTSPDQKYGDCKHLGEKTGDLYRCGCMSSQPEPSYECLKHDCHTTKRQAAKPYPEGMRACLVCFANGEGWEPKDDATNAAPEADGKKQASHGSAEADRGEADARDR